VDESGASGSNGRRPATDIGSTMSCVAGMVLLDTLYWFVPIRLVEVLLSPELNWSTTAKLSAQGARVSASRGSGSDMGSTTMTDRDSLQQWTRLAKYIDLLRKSLI
jgi:hypothetical protein